MKAEVISREKWLGLEKCLAMCGTTSPTYPTTPATETTPAQMTVTKPKTDQRLRSTFNPSDLA